MSESDISTGRIIRVAIRTADELGLFEKVKDYFSSKHRVLILGASGVGKTNLLNSLSDPLPGAIDPMDRTDFDIPAEKTKVDGVIFFFKDTPGHDKGDADPHKLRVDAINAARGSVTGIINVVSCGYHETKYVEKPTFETGQPPQEFLDACMRRERDLLKEWGPTLGHEQQLKWVFTVMNKADLWWSRYADLRTHYESGEYRTDMSIAQHVNHVVFPYCAEHRCFWNEGNVDQRFDDKVRNQLRSMLLSNFLSAVAS